VKKLLVLVLIAGVLFIAGDAWVRGMIEGRLASELQDSIGSSGDVDVSLGGFPFVVSALSGRIPSATVGTKGLTRGGLRFSDVSLTLRNIRFSLGKVLSGDLRAIRVGRGEGRAAIDADALVRAIERSGKDVEVSIVDDEVRVAAGGVSGTAEVSIAEDRLILGIAELGRDLVVPLPRVVKGISYESVEVVDARLELGFSLDEIRLTGL
jgi:hypothetical protein